MSEKLIHAPQTQLGRKLNWFSRAKRAIDSLLSQDIDAELARIAPDLVCNGYGTNIIDEKQRRVMVYIAHQRLLNRMNAILHFMQLGLMIVVLILVMRK